MFITKEFFLTTILSVVIYGATKWKPAHNLLSKVGFTKKSPKKECQDDLAFNEVSVVPAVAVIEDSISGTHEPYQHSQKHCDSTKKKQSYAASFKKPQRVETTSSSFTEKLSHTADQQTVQVGA